MAAQASTRKAVNVGRSSVPVSLASTVPSKSPVKIDLVKPSVSKVDNNVVNVENPNADGNSEKKKKKKKRLPKAERQRRKEEERMKSIYGPKDSHIHLISASTLQKLNSANSNSSQFSRSSFVSSSVQPEQTRSVAFSLDDFPSFMPTPPLTSTQPKGPYTKTRLLESDFPSLSPQPLLPSISKLSGSPSPANDSINSVPPQESKIVSKSKETEVQPLPTISTAEISSAVKPTPINNTQKTELCQKVGPSKSNNALLVAGADSSEVKPKSEPIILGASGVSTESNKKKSKKPLIVSFDALIAKKKPAGNAASKSNKRLRDLKSLAAAKSTKQTLGNILDSSGPMVIHRGKIREKPKKKKLTRLKKTILLSRLARAENLKPPLNENHQGSPTLTTTILSLTKSAPKTPEETSNVNTFENEALARGDLKTEELIITINNSVECGATAEQSSKKIVPETSCSLRRPVAFQPQEPKTICKIEDLETSRELICQRKESDDDILATLLNSVILEQVEESKLKSAKAKVEITTTVENDSLPPPIPENEVNPEMYAQAKKTLHNRKFRPYCDMYVTKELHGHVIGLMKELHRFQDRLYHTDPIKFQSKRRYVHGLKDTFTYLQLNKVVLIVLAPDMEANDQIGGLDDKLREIKTTASKKNIPVIFSGNRYILGKPCFIKSQVSAIAILDKQGAEEFFKAALDEASKLRTRYALDFNEKVQLLLGSQS